LWLLLALAAPCMAHGAGVEVSGLPRRVWGGRAIRPVVRVMDVGPDQTLRLVWAVLLDGDVLQGEIKGVRGAAEREIEIVLPQVRVRVSTTFAVHLFEGQGALAEESRRLDVFPSVLLAGLARAYEDRPVGLVAVGREPEAVTQPIPIRWRVLSSGAAVQAFQGEAFFLVADRQLRRRSDLTAALMERVEGGATVICLGDVVAPLPLEGAGENVQPGAFRAARLLAPEHPVFDTLEPGDLADWAADGVVARQALAWPESGNCTVLADAGPGPEPLALLVEVRRGAGRVLYCAPAVLEKLPQEPVAEVLLGNMVRWAFSPVEPLGKATVRLAGGSGLREVVAALAPGTGGEGGALVGDGSLLAGRGKELLAGLLRGGGTAVLFHLSEEDASALNGLLRARWERDVHASPPALRLCPARPDALRGFSLRAAHPLLGGVRPEDVHALADAGDWEDVHAIAAAADEEHFTDLMGGGLVAKLERDGVRLVFWQTPLSEEGGGAQERVLAAMFGNLGIGLTNQH